MTRFPTAWPVYRLGECVDVLDHKRVPVKAIERAARPGSVPYYGATGRAGTIDSAIFDEPLVLLGEDGAPFFDPNKPKAYLIDGPAWVNNHAHVLRVRGELSRKWLRYYLDQFNYQGYANGTTRLKLTQASMRRIPIPLPSNGEQRRIVEILEDHLSRLDAADHQLEFSGRRAEAWATALLTSEVWGRESRACKLGSLLREPMRNGRSDRASKSGEGVRTLTLTAVTRGEFSDEFTKITSTTADAARGLWLESGDIFVERANTPDLVGTSARYEGPSDWAIFPDLLIRVRADESLINGEFLALAMRSERCHRELRSRAKGLAGSMPKIDQAAVAAMSIPVPERDEQNLIVARVRASQDGGRSLANAITVSQRRSAGLRRAVLAAAFSGKLTGRRTDDEVIEETAAGASS